MMKTKSIVRIFAIFAINVFIVSSCESDADQLGKQFLSNTASIDNLDLDIIAYNVDNNDKIKSNAKVLERALLGAFNEEVFGMQKASYVTQLIPNDFNRDFGKNPAVDSVILQIVPKYNKVGSLHIYGKKQIDGVPAKLTIKVAEIGEFIGGSSDLEIDSDKLISEVKELGKGTIFSNKPKAINIKLDSDFFKTKIIDNQGQNEMKDVASFVRYFKGIRISVVEEDGFLFYFNPSNISLKMYYSYKKTEPNQTVTEKNDILTFNLGNVNTQFSQLEFVRPPVYKDAMNKIDHTNGDPKLYLQGAGGASAEFKIPESAIKELSNLYFNKNAGILSAKIVLSNDELIWNNDLEKPSNFTVLQKDTEQFMEDMIILRQSGFSQVNAKDLDKNTAYYELDVTQTLKNIIEKGADNKPITINVGTFAVDDKGVLKGWDNTTRAYTPNRIVLVGSDPKNDKRARLKVVYAKK